MTCRKSKQNTIELSGMEQKIEHILSYAIEAPSSHNTQPWRFKVSLSNVKVYADRERCLPVVDPNDRELAISCGAAIGYIEVAARVFDLETTVSYANRSQNPDFLADVEFSEGKPASLEELTVFEVIPTRRTNRSKFWMQSVAKEILSRCRELADRFDTDLAIIENESDREAVAELVSRGDRVQFDDSSFRRELAQWVRSSDSATNDGMSGAGFGIPDLLLPLGSLIIRTFDIGNTVAAGDAQKIVSGSPVLFVFASKTDDLDAWLNAGRALAHVLLYLSSHGISNSYLNQPIEVESLRSRLQAVTDSAEFPQLMLRIGYADAEPAPSARRDLSEVLL